MTDDQFAHIHRATYEAAVLAENAWQDELTRVYGRDATDARYDSNRNAATPMLAALYDLKTKTYAAWEGLRDIRRAKYSRNAA
jgi:hypothetical protein